MPCALGGGICRFPVFRYMYDIRYDTPHGVPMGHRGPPTLRRDCLRSCLRMIYLCIKAAPSPPPPSRLRIETPAVIYCGRVKNLPYHDPTSFSRAIVVMSEVPRGASGAAVAIAFTTLASLTLVARLFTRFRLVKSAGYEELAIVFAWVRITFSACEALLSFSVYSFFFSCVTYRTS